MRKRSSAQDLRLSDTTSADLSDWVPQLIARNGKRFALGFRCNVDSPRPYLRPRDARKEAVTARHASPMSNSYQILEPRSRASLEDKRRYGKIATVDAKRKFLLRWQLTEPRFEVAFGVR